MYDTMHKHAQAGPIGYQQHTGSVRVEQQDAAPNQVRGVVGKQTLFGIFAVLTLGAIACKTQSQSVEMLCIGVLFVVALMVILATGLYAHKHPQEATLEGAEVIAWNHQQMAAAKGREVSATAPVIADPQKPVIESPANATTGDVE